MLMACQGFVDRLGATVVSEIPRTQVGVGLEFACQQSVRAQGGGHAVFELAEAETSVDDKFTGQAEPRKWQGGERLSSV